MAKVTMPQLGESVAEGTIGKWLKQPGDAVAKYEPLLEVITDKVNAEVPSPYAGILTEILAEEGATVPNNAEIAIIATADEGAAGATTPAPATAATDASASDPANVPAPAPAPATRTAPAAEPPPVAHGPAGSDERPVPAEPTAPSGGNGAGAASLPGGTDARMTPAVRRLLREHGLAAAQIVGTGGGGRITREDVTDYVEAQRTGRPVGKQTPAVGESAAAAPAQAPAASASTSPAPVAPAPAASGAGATAAAPAPPPRASGPTITFPAGVDEVLVPMTQMRKGISAQMTRALAVPHAYVSVEVDATSLVRLREGAKRDFQAREGLNLSYVPLVGKALIDALTRHPQFNAHWTDDGLVAKRRINLGVAVAVADGLIVPVIRDAEQLSVAGLNRAIIDVANRARIGKLRLDDFGGGTFTLDNTGYLGSNLTMPIINVPEVAILTMEAITKRAVVVETPQGDVIGIRPVMNMVMGIDHRANDGGGAADFLRTVKAWLESVSPDLPLF